MKTTLRVFSYVRRYPGMATGMLACAVLGTLLVIVFPKVTQVIIDDVGHGRGDRLLPLVLVAAGAFFARDLFNALRIVLNNTFEQKVIFDLRSDLYAHIQQLPLTWFDNRSTGDIMTRLLEDVTAVERVLIDGIEQGVIAVLQIGVVATMLFFYLPWLAWLALIPVPLLAAGALAYTFTAPRRYRLQRKASSAMNSLLHDNLAGIRQIKTYVREREEHDRFNSTSNDLRTATLTVMRVWAIYNPAMSFLGACGAVLVIGFGGRAVLRGEMSVGDLVAFLWLVGALYEPIGEAAFAQSNRAIRPRRGRTRIRDSRHAGGTGPGGIRGERDGGRRCAFPGCELRVFRGIAGAASHQSARTPRRNDRAGRSHGCGQIDARASADAVLRIRLG